MKLLLSILFALLLSSLFSQRFEVFGGINRNRFFDFREENPHQSSSYLPKNGYSFGFALDSLSVEKMRWRFSLQYDNYAGIFEVSSGGMGGSITTQGDVTKSILGIGIFPLNFRMIKKKIDASFGFLFSVLLDEKFTGTNGGWYTSTPSSNGGSWSSDIKKGISSSSYFGFQGRFAYKIRISQKMHITPQYQFYFGFADEFDENYFTKSLRHCLCIGLMRKI